MQRNFSQDVMQRQQQMYKSDTLMISVIIKVTLDNITIKWGGYVTNNGMS